MRFNALKNSAEIYEKLGDYERAKSNYTQALKIREKDAFIWTRLGFMHYEVFRDLEMAKKCFESAA
jgi:tetratricopeptide (TPR) repeat protein